jgi:hypothetical protein
MAAGALNGSHPDPFFRLAPARQVFTDFINAVLIRIVGLSLNRQTATMNDSFLSNRKLRNIHRDLGYFYVGLIIAFAISGIAQNHRKQWKPDKYLYEHRQAATSFRLPKESVTKEGVDAFTKAQGLADFRQFDLRKDSTLVISYKDADATVKLATGQADINVWHKKPVLGQLVFLHKFNGKEWWTWYSDIFAIGLIIIAMSGMFLMRGKNSFRKRGWVLAILGMAVPLITMILLA